MSHRLKLSDGSRRCAVSACLLVGLVLPPAVPFAQTAPAPPSAGSLLRELQPGAVQPDTAPRPTLELPAPRTVVAPASGGPAVDVAGFRLTGIPAERADRLLPLTRRYVGPAKTLADLEDAAKDVEVALQRGGLFLAQVYVPAQEMTGGIVTLHVLEGRLGAVALQAEPGVKVSRAFMEDVLAPLRGNPVAEREMVERALFALGDLRGVAVTSSLVPGAVPGQADLVVKVAAGPRFGYSVDADNGGSAFTGRYRLNAGIDWSSPAGRGDVASLKALTSTNGGVQFVRGAWLVPVTARGTKAGFAASFLRYSLGTPLFEPLNATGTASAYALQLLHPLLRSRNQNLFLQASVERRRFEDKVGAIALVTKKGATSYATLGVVGDFRDTALGGGITNYSANVVAGRLNIDSAADLAADQSLTGFRSAGGYAKLVLTASRLQALPNKDFLYLSSSAQAATKNLDSSEKFNLGGPNGVRGYPSPESPSDSGAILTWEYRKPLRFESLRGDFVLSLFGDYGIGRIHHEPLPGDAQNVRRLVSHGLGVVFADDKGLLLKAYVAVRGGVQAQSDDSRARLVVQAGKQF